MKNHILIILTLFLSINESYTNGKSNFILKNNSVAAVNDTIKNKNTATIKRKNNVIEVYQKFTSKGNNQEVLGEAVDIDLISTSGAMLSAYSKSKDNYLLFFRTKENNSWTNWKELKENKEVKDPTRKAFSPKSLSDKVTQIQFKSNQLINKDVVFRIYTFKKR